MRHSLCPPCSEGSRVGWSDEILGFDCGGQQWVLETAFPAGTLDQPDGRCARAAGAGWLAWWKQPPGAAGWLRLHAARQRRVRHLVP